MEEVDWNYLGSGQFPTIAPAQAQATLVPKQLSTMGKAAIAEESAHLGGLRLSTAPEQSDGGMELWPMCQDCPSTCTGLSSSGIAPH